MTNLVVLLLCLALGAGLRASHRLPADAHRALNGFVVNVALPALILRHVHDLRYDPGLLPAALMPWVMFAAGIAFCIAAGRLTGWSRGTTAGLILSGGLANTSFVGLPMIETFYGASFLSLGILIDQLGSYMVLSTAGVLIASLAARDGRLAWRPVAGKVAAFAPFQALVLALLLIPVRYPDMLAAVLDRLGSTLVPLALVSVGYQIRLSEVRGNLLPLAAGLLFKLLLGPAFICLLLLLGARAGGKIAEVTIFESAMGPMIGGAIVAIEYGLAPRLVGLMVGLGIPLSLLSATGWWWVLSND